MMAESEEDEDSMKKDEKTEGGMIMVRPPCWEEEPRFVNPNVQAPRKPKGAKKKEKREAEREEQEEQEAEEDDTIPTVSAKKKVRKARGAKAANDDDDDEGVSRKRKTSASKARAVATSSASSAKMVLPGPSLPLDSHPDRVREFMDKWGMRDSKANGEDGEVETSHPPQDDMSPAEAAELRAPRSKRKKAQTDEEKEEARKLRSRKCCAYSKVRNKAMKEGKTDEEAKALASEARVVWLDGRGGR